MLRSSFKLYNSITVLYTIPAQDAKYKMIDIITHYNLTLIPIDDCYELKVYLASVGSGKTTFQLSVDVMATLLLII